MVSGLAMMPSHEEDSLATISDLEHGLSLPLDHSEDSDSNPDEHQIQVCNPPSDSRQTCNGQMFVIRMSEHCSRNV